MNKEAVFTIKIDPGDGMDNLTFYNTATDEQINRMFYGLAESNNRVAALALYGMIDQINSKRPGFARHIKKEMITFKSKSNE